MFSTTGVNEFCSKSCSLQTKRGNRKQKVPVMNGHSETPPPDSSPNPMLALDMLSWMMVSHLPCYTPLLPAMPLPYLTSSKSVTPLACLCIQYTVILKPALVTTCIQKPLGPVPIVVSVKETTSIQRPHFQAGRLM